MMFTSSRLTGIWLLAGVALLAAAVWYNWPLQSPSRLDRTAASAGIDLDDSARMRALEQRIAVLEDIVSRRNGDGSRRSGRRLGQNADHPRVALVSSNGKDVIEEKLNAAMALESKFDNEVGLQSRKSVKTQGVINNAFNEVTAVEPRYAPSWAAQPECRTSMCRLQYRYRDEAVAEYASTALLMELNSYFSDADVVILPNNDATYDLLIYGRIK